MGGRSDSVDIGASGARNRRNGESIAQRSRRSQRGWDWDCWEGAAVNVWDSEREAVDGEASTQATEGDWVWWPKGCGETSGLPVRDQANGSGDASHTLSGTDTDTSFGRSLTLPTKKTGGTPRCSASQFTALL